MKPVLAIPSITSTFRMGNRSVELDIPDLVWVEKNYFDNIDASIPYWTKLWPAAFALAEWIEAHHTLFTGRSWLEIGAGLGLPSILLQHHHCTVYTTDHDQQALAFLRLNQKRYGWTHMHVQHFDWQQHRAIPPVDGILLADVNYDPRAASILLQQIQRWMQKGLTIYLTTPHRLAGRHFVEQLTQWGFHSLLLPYSAYAPEVSCSLYWWEPA